LVPTKQKKTNYKEKEKVSMPRRIQGCSIDLPHGSLKIFEAMVETCARSWIDSIELELFAPRHVIVGSLAAAVLWSPKYARHSSTVIDILLT
jgi:hypothetical protein